MDDLIGIVVLILYIVAAGAAGKNKKRKKEKRQAAGTRAVQFEQAFDHLTSEQHKMVEESIAKVMPPEIKIEQFRRGVTGEGQDPCHEEMLRPERPSMRVQSVSQTQLHAAAEGEDPCHVGDGMLIDQNFAESPIEHSPIFDTEDTDAFARDVLRGVIMSEVLARPTQHRWGANMKRGA